MLTAFGGKLGARNAAPEIELVDEQTVEVRWGRCLRCPWITTVLEEKRCKRCQRCNGEPLAYWIDRADRQCPKGDW